MKIFKIMLLPVSLLWSHIYGLRRFFYNIGWLKSFDLGVPVISIGNLSFGGTGKTPHVIWLAKLLEKAGFSSQILTRGYKSSLENSGTKLNSENLNLAGDEPRLLFENLNSAIIVGKNRVSNFFKYGSCSKNTIAILDDGFQHLKIRRNLDIVLLDATIEYQKMACGPLGGLRESFENLKFADIVILTKANLVPSKRVEEWRKLVEEKTKKRVFESIIKVGGIYKEKSRIDELPSKSVIALSGIGNPESFEHVIEQMGLIIEKHFKFTDHHNYSKDDLEGVLECAKQKNIPVLSTEKDYMKIQDLINENDNFNYVKIEVEVKDQDRFIKLMNKRVKHD